MCNDTSRANGIVVVLTWNVLHDGYPGLRGGITSKKRIASEWGCARGLLQKCYNLTNNNNNKFVHSMYFVKFFFIYIYLFIYYFIIIYFFAVQCCFVSYTTKHHKLISDNYPMYKYKLRISVSYHYVNKCRINAKFRGKVEQKERIWKSVRLSVRREFVRVNLYLHTKFCCLNDEYLPHRFITTTTKR